MNFQGDNEITIIRQHNNVKYCKFREPYTITICNCKPCGVVDNEFYVQINANDRSLANFMNDIFKSMDIIDGSLDKTLLGGDVLTLINNGSVSFIHEKSDDTINVSNLDLLGEQYHLLTDDKLTVTFSVGKFKIISNRYLVMDFELAKLQFRHLVEFADSKLHSEPYDDLTTVQLQLI